MAKTRSFKELVQRQAATDEAFAEALLREVIRASPRSDDASHAHHLLSRIFIRSAQYARLVENFDRWSAAFPNRPEVLAERHDVDPFRGLPDQRNGPVRAATVAHGRCCGRRWSRCRRVHIERDRRHGEAVMLSRRKA